jgi:hypothetical protein
MTEQNEKINDAVKFAQDVIQPEFSDSEYQEFITRLKNRGGEFASIAERLSQNFNR